MIYNLISFIFSDAVASGLGSLQIDKLQPIVKPRQDDHHLRLEGHAQLFERAQWDNRNIDKNGSQIFWDGGLFSRKLNRRFFLSISVLLKADGFAVVFVGRIVAVVHFVATFFDRDAAAIVASVLIFQALLETNTFSYILKIFLWFNLSSVFL